MCAFRIAVILMVLIGMANGEKGARFRSGKVRLTRAVNGINGWVEVGIDSRLNQQLRDGMWDRGDWSFVLSEDDPLRKAFASDPPRNAELRIVNAHGQLVDRETLDRPLARVEKINLGNGTDYVLVTADYSIGMGSYAGPVSEVWEVHGGHLRPVNATDVGTGKTESIAMASTLKHGWRIARGAESADIFVVSCHPNFVDGDFVVDYIRYHFDGKKWLRYARTKKGYWESDDPFPGRAAFR